MSHRRDLFNSPKLEPSSQVKAGCGSNHDDSCFLSSIFLARKAAYPGRSDMIVEQARELARQWVMKEIGAVPGFGGAFFHGSTAWLPAAAPISGTSDIDVILVFAQSPPRSFGKLLYQGVILDVSWMPESELQPPELILGNYYLAGSFRAPGIIADPAGRLTKLQAVVTANFAEYAWVTKRCEHARSRVLRNIRSLTEFESFPDRVIAWLFASGVLTHILLVAGLQNPTVRRRYLAVRRLLRDYDLAEVYDRLLEQLGCARIRPDQVRRHLAGLTATYDAAKSVIRSPFSFAADISDIARPIAIDGSRELIEQGYHREAVFWLVATYSRCMKVLAQDAPRELQAQFEPGYRALLGDLGIASAADLQRRSAQVTESLPRIWQTAQRIMKSNPEITGAPRSLS
jgi:hypothetical protein